MDAPDYSNHTPRQLRQILGRIDAARYPERVAEIEARLAGLQLTPPSWDAMIDANAATLAPVAALWRRILASVIDTFLLGLLGIALGAVLHAQFSAMGPWGRLVGFVIALLYFGLTQSHLRGGQSAGMHLLGIRVVTRTGEPLSIAAALIRTAIFCVPYFLNGVEIDAAPGQEWIGMALLVPIGLVSLISAYLVVFNHKTRQSLYDLAVGAYVVHAGQGRITLFVERIWRGHAVVAILLALGIVAGSVAIFPHLPNDASAQALRAAQRHIVDMPGVWRASVQHQTFKADGRTVHRLFVTAVVADASPQPQRQLLAQRMALAALDGYPEASQLDQVIVSMLAGYDIGIAHSMDATVYDHTPLQWRSGAIKAVELRLPRKP